MPDTEGPEMKRPGNREFMREKIVKQPLSKKEIVKRVAAFFCLAVLFGMLSALSFVFTKPLAERYLGKGRYEDPSISFMKDEPETAPSEAACPQLNEEEAHKDIDEAVVKALSEYKLSMGDLNSMYGAIRESAQQGDKGIVTVSSGKQQLDLFGNPVENTGDYAGAIIAKTKDEYLIFTYEEAVAQADSISVTFYDGTKTVGQAKQIDGVLGMAVVAVKVEELSQELREGIQVLVLGNSYSVKAGDFIIGVGSPSGMVHSTTYGNISYIAKNVRMTDGTTRVLYADLHSNSRMGTFLLNTSGELIGWASDQFRTDDNRDVTTAVSISDYKLILEKMTNGKQVPYFGVKGQEVNGVMSDSGIPKGVYVMETAASGPAYDAGIQNGDIITCFANKKITTFKDMQNQIENAKCGTSALVKVMRKGREGYKELEYHVEIRAR